MTLGRTALALMWLALCGFGCDALKLGGKEAIIKATVKSCSSSTAAKHQGLDCECLVRQAVADMSPEEVRLWASIPDLFDEEEVQVLLTRKAMPCLKPQLVAGCVSRRASKEECTCVADGVLEAFSGDELLDLAERLRNGSAVNPEAARIRLDCAARFAKKKAF